MTAFYAVLTGLAFACFLMIQLCTMLQGKRPNVGRTNNDAIGSAHLGNSYFTVRACSGGSSFGRPVQ